MSDFLFISTDSFVEYLVYKWCQGDETNGEEMLEYVKAMIDTDGTNHNELKVLTIF